MYNLCLPSLPFNCRRSTLFEGWKDTISGQVWLPRCYGFPGTSVSAPIVMLSLRPWFHFIEHEKDAKWNIFCIISYFIYTSTFWSVLFACYYIVFFEYWSVWILLVSVCNIWESSRFGWCYSTYRKGWMCISRNDFPSPSLFDSQS